MPLTHPVILLLYPLQSMSYKLKFFLALRLSKTESPSDQEQKSIYMYTHRLYIQPHTLTPLLTLAKSLTPCPSLPASLCITSVRAIVPCATCYDICYRFIQRTRKKKKYWIDSSNTRPARASDLLIYRKKEEKKEQRELTGNLEKTLRTRKNTGFSSFFISLFGP